MPNFFIKCSILQYEKYEKNATAVHERMQTIANHVNAVSCFGILLLKILWYYTDQYCLCI